MIEILETTFREGEQTSYVNFMPDEKVAEIFSKKACGSNKNELETIIHNKKLPRIILEGA